MKHRQVGVNRVGPLNRDGHMIGLDIGATAVRAAVLTPGTVDGRPSVTVQGLGQIELAAGVVINGAVEEPDALAAALKRLWQENKFNCRNVVLGIAHQQVLVRDITIPKLSPQQRAKALPFQAREIVALPLDQVVLDFCQLGDVDPDTNMMRGLLIATPREPVLAAVRAVERAGLKVGRVDLSAFGLLRSIGAEIPAVEALVDLGAHLTTIVIHDHGVPKLIRTLPRGGRQLTEQISDRMGTDELDAERAKRDVGLEGDRPEMTRVLTDALRPLVAELRTSIQYFRSANDGAAIDRMSLTGGGSQLRGIDTVLENQIGLPTQLIDPMQHIRNRHAPDRAWSGNSAEAHGAVSLGLAMGTAA